MLKRVKFSSVPSSADDGVALRHTKFVDHVHFHVIPKPSDSKEEGLVVEWPQKTLSQEELAAIHKELMTKL